jgi:hypothetical protein
MFEKTKRPELCNIKCPFNSTLCPYDKRNDNRYSCSFDGIDEYINCGDIASFERTNSFSISLWLKTSVSINSIPIARQESSGNYRGWRIVFFSNKINFALYNSTINCISVSGSVAVQDGLWHHIVITYNGSSLASGVKIYTDGVLNTLTTLSNTLTDTIINSVPMTIGWRYLASTYYTGNLDEISIWNKELSQYDVTEIYQRHITNCPFSFNASSNLISSWRMGDRDTYPIINDISKYNNGTMVNMSSSNFTGDTP